MMRMMFISFDVVWLYGPSSLKILPLITFSLGSSKPWRMARYLSCVDDNPFTCPPDTDCTNCIIIINCEELNLGEGEIEESMGNEDSVYTCFKYNGYIPFTP